MSFYPDRIAEHFLHPRSIGEIENADAVGDTGSLICGAALRLTLAVAPASLTISEAKFKAAGCGYLIASASVLTELLQEVTIGEAGRLSEGPLLEQAITEHLGPMPQERRHCISLCREALATAIRHYRTTTLEEWNGDEALICTCFGVAEKSIEYAIRAGALLTVEQVTRACNAGGGCRSCHPLIEDILEDYWRTEATEVQQAD